MYIQFIKKKTVLIVLMYYIKKMLFLPSFNINYNFKILFILNNLIQHIYLE